MFERSLKDVENIYWDIAGVDMSYEFKGLCREAWKNEDFICFYTDRSENKNEGKYCV